VACPINRARHFHFPRDNQEIHSAMWLFICRIGLLAALLGLLADGAQRSAGVDFVGYLPGYQMKCDYVEHVLPEQLPLLDEIRYFGITTDDAGRLTTKPADLENVRRIKAAIDRLPKIAGLAWELRSAGGASRTVFRRLPLKTPYGPYSVRTLSVYSTRLAPCAWISTGSILAPPKNARTTTQPC
jgi:hypothetical protein